MPDINELIKQRDHAKDRLRKAIEYVGIMQLDIANKALTPQDIEDLVGNLRRCALVRLQAEHAIDAAMEAPDADR